MGACRYFFLIPALLENDCQATCNHFHRFNQLAAEVKIWNGCMSRLACNSVRPPLIFKTSVDPLQVLEPETIPVGTMVNA